MKFALVSNLVTFGTCTLAMAALLNTALQNLRHTLLPVIHDARGTLSHRSTAYEFFIKDSSQAQLVANVITNITIGNAQYPPEPMFNNGNPTFVCVSPGLMGLTSPEGITHDAYDNCEQNEGAISFYLYPKPWIMLCPGFFELPSHPASDACPTVDRLSTHFIPKSTEEDVTGESISQTQIWSIFHELVYYYLYAQPGYEVLHSKEQVYNINKAWKLSPAEAFENAENWVYYAYRTMRILPRLFSPETPPAESCFLSVLQFSFARFHIYLSGSIFAKPPLSAPLPSGMAIPSLPNALCTVHPPTKQTASTSASARSSDITLNIPLALHSLSIHLDQTSTLH
ncbi:hypothetical protein G7Y79_00022g052960 [Physcia stellaris]|nr:hypothetical protein G7Y79_00022g052960 [Physcia stellaris]